MRIRPRRYVTADEHHAMIEKRVIQIQCFIRQCYAREKAKKLRKDRDHRLKVIEEV